MNRTDLKTNLGRHIYDYSPLRKSSIPIEILDDLSSSYMLRQNIIYYHRVYLEDVCCYVALSTPSMVKYSLWRNAFMEHGYEPPILDLISSLKQES
jgi:hypothetical protein